MRIGFTPTKKNCENKHKITIEDIVQIKQIADSNYVYYGGFDINVYNRTLSCPPFVFALPTTASFSIDTLQYEAKQVIIESEIDLITPLSQRINFYLFPQIHEFDFETLAQQVRKDINDIDFESLQNKFDYHTSIRAVDFFYIFSLICVIIVHHSLHSHSRLSN
jgi:hypothetical protein